MTNNKYIQVLTVLLDAEISYREIPQFRGAILKSLGDKASLLYHNHTGNNTYRYAYPFIQYKRLGGKAAIVCVDKGTDAIGQYFSEVGGTIKIGNREISCSTARIFPRKVLMQVCWPPFKYHINRWLPLNSKNYRLYQSTDDEGKRLTMLEDILKANLLSMLKWLDIYMEDEVQVKIVKLDSPYILYNKGIGMMAFNADFICNLPLPNDIGIGKNASIGFGVVRQVQEDLPVTQANKP